MRAGGQAIRKTDRRTYFWLGLGEIERWRGETEKQRDRDTTM
jgi:hypothetical protein